MLMGSTILRGGNLSVTEEGIREAVRSVELPLWNTWYFFALYSGTCNGGAGYLAKPIDTDDAAALAGLDVMDRYVLARTRDMANAARDALDAYDIPAATQAVRDYLDVLTNWYVRTQRDRFWSEDDRAFDTLFTALETLTRVMAPLFPMVSEEIWRGLTGGRSVHLTDWPELGEALADPTLVAEIDEVREIVSAAHSLRKANKLRVRQPLRSLTVVTHLDLDSYRELIAGEVNVKSVLLKDVESSGMQAKRELAVLPRELEPSMRKLTSVLFKAAREGNWQEVDGGVQLNVEPPVVLGQGQYTLTTQVVSEEGSVAAMLGSGSFISLDTVLDEELEAEGYARDVVRAVQDERKRAGLHVADRIELTLRVRDANVAAVEAFLDFIKEETSLPGCRREWRGQGHRGLRVAKISERVNPHYGDSRGIGTPECRHAGRNGYRATQPGWSFSQRGCWQ